MKKQTDPTPPVVPPLPALREPNRVSLVRCLLLACMLGCAGRAGAASPLSLDVAMKSVYDPQPPRMVEDTLILSFRLGGKARFVGVRFAHESWAVLHPCAVNENGVFVLDYPVTEGLREIRYRIVVDGQWMTDPLNANVATDLTGTEFSVFTLEKEPARPVVNPRVERDGSVTFVFRGKAGRRVAIVGDFNNWDPFMDSLSEGEPGAYSVNLRVPPGRHWYYFVSDGRRILDMFNAANAMDPDGGTVSTFTIPS